MEGEDRLFIVLTMEDRRLPCNGQDRSFLKMKDLLRVILKRYINHM